MGDGCLHYALGEIASLRETGARVVVLVRTNASYGEIRSAVRAQGITPVGVALLIPDMAALASAYGPRSDRAAEMAAADRPSLIELEEAALPGGARR